MGHVADGDVGHVWRSLWRLTTSTHLEFFLQILFISLLRFDKGLTSHLGVQIASGVDVVH